MRNFIIAITLTSCNTAIAPFEMEYHYWNDECIHIDKSMIWYDEETMRCTNCGGYVPPKNRKR